MTLTNDSHMINIRINIITSAYDHFYHTINNTNDYDNQTWPEEG